MMHVRGLAVTRGVFLTVALLATLPAAQLLHAQAGQPITHEAMWQMKRLGAPVVSPDGRWAVVAVTEPAYDSQRQYSDLWLTTVDGSEPPRRLTFSRGAESGVSWSPDGRRLAFAARRDGDDASQLYVLDLAAGGEALRITTLSTGASSPRWSPDGRSLLFSSSLYPGLAGDSAQVAAAAERGNRRYRARVYDGFPIRDFDRWIDERQPRLFVVAAEVGARPMDLLGGSPLVAEPGFGGSADLQATWTPDGAAIVFVAATTRHTAAHADVPSHLYRVGAHGGEPVALTSGTDSYFAPSFSPDGRTLYALTNPYNEHVYNVNRLVALRWPQPGAPTVLTADWDRSVSRYQTSADGRTLYLLAEDLARDRIFTMPATGGPVRVLTADSRGVYSGLSVSGVGRNSVLVANWESAANPPEVVRVDERTGQHRNVTSFNTEATARLDLPPLREFWIDASTGRRVQSFIALPPGFDENQRYPLFVVMHGGPHGAWKDQFVIRWNYHLLAKPGYVVLLTNFTGSTGFGEAFAQAIHGRPAGGPGAGDQRGRRRGDPRYPFIDGVAPGGRRCQLRRPPRLLDAGDDRPVPHAHRSRRGLLLDAAEVVFVRKLSA
jgi:dipeptidyl aminopeptidase/acylaminoacyl peptidase